MSHNLQIDFNSWVDAAVAKSIPKSVIAFNFNLYESTNEFHVDLIGSDIYSENNPDWACNELFIEREVLFRLPHQAVGTEWQQALNAVIGLVRNYMQSGSAGASRLCACRAVTVGFVDGDLTRVWP